MSRNETEQKISAITIVAVLMGAGGLAMGGLSMIIPTPGPAGTNGTLGQDGTDGQDAPGYYCNTYAQVQSAIDTIGTSSGVIIITESITLTATLDVDQGGSYVFQGSSGTIEIDTAGDRACFNITEANACTIKDLTIRATGISSSIGAIEINETNDASVNIQNVKLIGGASGYGIDIYSENVKIQLCYISSFSYGIYLRQNSQSCQILDNTLRSTYSHCIYVEYSDFNILQGNIIADVNDIPTTLSGIYLTYSDNNIIDGNIIKNNTANAPGGFNGIYTSFSYHNVISDNVIKYLFSDSGDLRGIYMVFSTHNTITGNSIDDITSDSGVYGIDLASSTFNTVSGNSIDDLQSNSIEAFGIKVSSNNNTINSNIIYDISAGGSGYGIYINGNYNIIIGNSIDLVSAGAFYETGLSTGNVIEHNLI